jgi:hypothetical protein
MPTPRITRPCSSPAGSWWAADPDADRAHDPHAEDSVPAKPCSHAAAGDDRDHHGGRDLPADGAAGHYFKLQALPSLYFVFLPMILLAYMALTQAVKGFYIRRFGWQ